jgi:hypothetical protein
MSQDSLLGLTSSHLLHTKMPTSDAVQGKLEASTTCANRTPGLGALPEEYKPAF